MPCHVEGSGCATIGCDVGRVFAILPCQKHATLADGLEGPAPDGYAEPPIPTDRRDCGHQPRVRSADAASGRRAGTPPTAARRPGSAGGRRSAGTRRASCTRQRHGLIPHPGRGPMESGDGELPGHLGQRVLDRCQRTGRDRGFRQPHRHGAGHRTRHRDAERHGLPGDRAAGRDLSARARRDAGRDLRRADAARAGHLRLAGPLRRGRRRHADADRGDGHRGFRSGHGTRCVASGRSQSDRHDQRHRHAPGRRRPGAARCVPDRDAGP